MTALYAAVLGIVQGLTEFLPISSSAHLIVARAVLGWDMAALGLAFDVACHVGTLLAVMLYFRPELTSMVRELPRMLSADTDGARWLRQVGIGTVPVVIVGLTLADYIETHLRSPEVAAVTLAVGAFGLVVAERVGARQRLEGSLGYGEAFGLGVAQALALVPGVSRAGATLTLGLLLGLRREAAARFSFLLGVPAILAAAAKTALDLPREAMGMDVVVLFLVGAVTSAVVGYLTVKYFLRYLVGHTLNGFAAYRLVMAATLAVWLIRR